MTGLGLGLALGLTGSSGGVLITDPFIGAAGDSTAERMFTQFTGAGETAFETQAANYYTGTVDYYDAANSGTFLLESTALTADAGNTNVFWVDDSGALANGPQFTNNIINDGNDANCYICSLGINDNTHIAGASVTIADVEAAFSYMADTATADTTATFMMLNPLGRDAGGSDTGCNIIREGIIDAINNNPKVKRGVDTYDLERTDNKHLVQAGDEAKGTREAIQSAKYLGNTTLQALGPRVTAASLKTDVIELTLSHVGGTDITAPTAGNGGMDATDDGTAMGATTLTRVNATTAQLDFPISVAPVDGSTVKVYVPYGKDGGLAAVPDVMKDNSSLALPIQSDVVTATNDDPIQALDNLVTYFDARGSVKTLTGTDIEVINKLSGSVASLDEVDAGDHAVWSGSGLNRRGSLKYQALTQLLYSSGFTAGSTHTFGFTLELPFGTPSGDVLFFGNSGAGTDNQAKLVFAAGILYYGNKETGGVAAVSDTLTGGTQHTVIFEFVDNDTLNVYWNGETTPSYSIDPVDDFNAWEYILLGARTAGAENGAYVDFGIGAYFHTLDVLTSTEKANISTYWDERFIDYAPEWSNITTASYVRLQSVSAQAGAPADMCFNSDHTKMLLLDNTTDTVYEYTLTTAEDVSTLSYTGNSFSVTSQENNPRFIFTNADGTEMFVGGLGSDSIHRYDLGTAFDLSSVTNPSVSYNFSAQATTPLGGVISDDGEIVYVIENGGMIYQYDMTTGFDLTTMSYSGNSLDVSGQVTNAYDLALSPSGRVLYVVDWGGDYVYQYDLSTAGDISTATYTSGNRYATLTSESMTGLYMPSNGNKMYLVGTAADSIYEYDLG